MTRDPDTQAAIDLAREEPETWSARSAAAGWGHTGAEESVRDDAPPVKAAPDHVLERHDLRGELARDLSKEGWESEGDRVYYLHPDDLAWMHHQFYCEELVPGNSQAWISANRKDSPTWVLAASDEPVGSFRKVTHASGVIAALRKLSTDKPETWRGRRLDVALDDAQPADSLTLTGPELAAYRALRDAAAQAHAAQQSMATTGQQLRDAIQKLCAVIAPGVPGGK